MYVGFPLILNLTSMDFRHGLKFLLDQTLESLKPRHEEILAAFYFDEGRQIEKERLLRAGNGHLRAFAASTVQGILLVWIESHELAAVHPFLLDKLELPLDVGLNHELDQAAIHAVVLERAVLPASS